jgi:uncharacterized repeat protein (TIGR02543 family)
LGFFAMTCANPMDADSSNPNSPAIYTVTFRPQGGSPEPETQSVTEGGKASAPGAMTKVPLSGLYLNAVTFDGWYTDPEYTTAWDFNAPVTGNLNLYAKWSQPPSVDLSGQSGGNTLAKALAYIGAQSLSEETSFTIVLDENHTMSGTSSANINTANAVITLAGNGPTTISLSGIGNLFYITNGKLVLDNNITLKGTDENEAPLVMVDGASASLTMKAGAKVTGNANTVNAGGGVYVVNDAGFTMEGGEISGNSAFAGGGGGGGVLVLNSSFTMKGGEISGNSAFVGGGVGVIGSFTMSGGKISGNSAAAAGLGGGVFVSGSFTKTGGVIYGDTDNTHTPGSTENTAANSALGSGHGVYYYTIDGTASYYRDATLDSGDDISTSDTLPANAGESLNNWTKQ